MKESAVTRVTGGLSGSGRGGMEWWVLMEVCVALLSPRGQLYKTGVLTCQRVLLYESVSIRWVGKGGLPSRSLSTCRFGLEFEAAGWVRRITWKVVSPAGLLN